MKQARDAPVALAGDDRLEFLDAGLKFFALLVALLLGCEALLDLCLLGFDGVGSEHHRTPRLLLVLARVMRDLLGVLHSLFALVIVLELEERGRG